jgi:DNA-binding MurR/RpiR family transcriptional regulator
MTKSILNKIDALYTKLSKGHKKIADYIMVNYDKAAFMTAARLGATVGVSESTVVRFAAELGFSGYPALQSDLQELIRSKLTSVQRMQSASVRIAQDEILETVLNADSAMIKATLDQTSKDNFNRAVAAINKARNIYILGVRSAATLANFLAFYFRPVYDNVVLVDSARASEVFEQIFRIDERDICIAISFPRYSNQTINALHFIHDKGATVISITDSELSPIAKFADCLLIARSTMASFVDSLVAPLSLINALIVAATFDRRSEVYDNLNELEKIYDEYNIYDKQEASGEDET